MLRALQLRNFRCFESIAVEFSSGFNFIVGANGLGKTTAAGGCLRSAAFAVAALHQSRAGGSRRAAIVRCFRTCRRTFAPILSTARFGERWLSTGSNSTITAEYLRLARVVSFANHDLDLVRGPAELRRRYLDFIGSQVDARYRPALRAYERALRSRNALLKSPRPRPRELEAYTEPLVRAGCLLREMRADLVDRLKPFAVASQNAISGKREILASRICTWLRRRFRDPSPAGAK